MVTKAEFRRSFQHYLYRHSLRIAGVFLIGALVFGVVWLILELVDTQDEVRIEAAMAVAFIVAIAVAGLSAQSAAREGRADDRLVCPHCDGALGSYEGVIVLSSSRCPHCGGHVLDDD